MNTLIIGLVRVLIYAGLIYAVYNETGIYTSISLGVIFSFHEVTGSSLRGLTKILTEKGITR